MSYHKELDFNNNIDSISGLQFSLMSPEEIEKRSVAEIVTQETYDGDNPKVGGLFDPRMGILDHGRICPTDGLDNRFCPGYFGHINLAQPVLHIQFLNYIIRSLKCVCFRCSACLIDLSQSDHMRNLSKKKGYQRSNYVYSECKNIKRCGEKNENGCGCLQPSNIKKESSSIGKICAEWKISKSDEGGDKIEEHKKMIWNADDVLKILKRVSLEDAELMGFNRNWCLPHWMICTVLPVPPPSVRPSVRNETNTRMEDDLTHKLCDIIKTNRILKQKIEGGAPKNIVDEWTQLLQYHVATLIDNSQPGIPPAQQRSGRPLKSIRERLRSKEGRVRGNLMGKRVDYSARSVITPDPNIEIDQLGVPKKIAMNLTYPEKVTKYNLDYLRVIVKNGYDTWPGAKSIKRVSDGQIISLRHISPSSINLEIGDIVNRHIIDDDIVLFNRQPSLHRMSMMAHRVKVMEYQSFRLNVSVTTPYNADFDGDEMNMHVPQSVQTSVEIDKLANVVSQIISPAQNRPIISFVQDTLLGSYMFTQYNQYFNKREVLNLVVATKLYDGTLPPPTLKKGTSVSELPFWFCKDKYIHYLKNDELVQDLWNGIALLSIVIPEVNLVKKNGYFNDAIEQHKFMNKIEIKGGKIKNGIFDKSVLGGKSGGLIHLVYNDFDKDKCKNFLDGVQNIVTKFMLSHSFSVGIGDLVANRYAMDDMKNTVKEKKKKVIEIIESVHNGILENNSGKPMSDEFEIQVNASLNAAVEAAGKIAETHLSDSNRMINIVRSGSKGSVLNIGQMIALVGQQNVDGKRIPYGFTDRTLPHFHKYDDGPSARGFVENSFLDGLNPHEFFFHAMGGREGVIDTAVKTSETGYIQRKLVKAMEDLKIENDYTVRSASGTIVQFLYGEDGMDPLKIEDQKLHIVSLNYNQIKEQYHCDLDVQDIENLYTDDIYNRIISDKEKYQEVFNDCFHDIVEYRRITVENIFREQNDDDIHYPVNIRRLINNTVQKFGIIKGEPSDLDPIYIYDKIIHLKNTLVIPFTDSKSNTMLQILLHSYLSPYYCVTNYGLSKTAFDFLTQAITNKFLESIDCPGNLVGIIAAQSIGEPATQMTLNTFHFAGVGSKSEVVRGVPRLKEIISASKNIKSPLITAFLDDDSAYNKEKATNVLNNIGISSIKDISISSSIYYEHPDDPDPIDSDLINLYREFEEYGLYRYEGTSEKVNPWVLRFKFDRQEMIDREIKMIDIYNAINFKFNKDNRDTDDIICVYSDDNAEELIFRIQCVTGCSEENDGDEDDIINLLKTLEDTILNDIILKGIKNINKATMTKEQNYLRKNHNDYKSEPQWVIEAQGTNLIDILNCPHIDFSKTYSNNINEIYEILGIEATREAIIQEITELLSYDGTYINYRHIALLADIMTNRGHIMSIDRHGINKSERGPLAKCSFEETPDVISKAAVFGEFDKITGVSSNIMLGQEVHAGTTFCDVLFDEEQFIQNIIDKEETGDIDISEEIKLSDEFEYCDEDDFGMEI